VRRRHLPLRCPPPRRGGHAAVLQPHQRDLAAPVRARLRRRPRCGRRLAHEPVRRARHRLLDPRNPV
ncbi:MAG: hypothetical protein AVDCRST_MAG85-1629, partial [uncultured Solirubrobacteraceae bacterium]